MIQRYQGADVRSSIHIRFLGVNGWLVAFAVEDLRWTCTVNSSGLVKVHPCTKRLCESVCARASAQQRKKTRGRERGKSKRTTEKENEGRERERRKGGWLAKSEHMSHIAESAFESCNPIQLELADGKGP
jgi:hypothetical protein